MSLKSANKTETNTYSIEISVDAESFEKAIVKAYNSSKNKFNIPGFRRGKAPRSFIERMYGEDVFFDEALNIIFPDEYEAAVEASGIEPVAEPYDLDVPQVGKEGATITFKVTVKPEAQVGNYKGLAAEKGKAEATDEEVGAELERMRERNSRMITVEDRAVENGDTANIDFEGFVDGVAFDGGKGEGYDLVIGSGTFIPGFEEQLIGANINDEIDVNVTFPEDYHSEELKGQAAVFKVKINEIKFKQLPEINDEFASDVSEFETLDEYKSDIRVKLTEQAQTTADRKYEDDIIKKVADNATIEIPEVMVNHRLDDMMRQLDMQLRYQGMNLEGYLQMMGMDISKVRADYHDNALEDVKTQLVLEKISEVENIITSPEEYDAELEEMAKRYNQPIEEMKKHLHDDDIEYIKSSIERKKTIKMLVENAKE